MLSLAIPYMCTELVIKLQIAHTRKEVKQQMILGMDKEELIELEFNTEEANELEWIKSHEFRYDGLMYDVIETSMEGDKMIYLCFPDHQETALNKELDMLRAIAHNNHLPRQKSEYQLASFLKSLFFNDLDHFAEPLKEREDLPIAFTTSIYSVDFEKETPPPRS